MMSIIDEILKDVREDENWLRITNRSEWEKSPGSRASVYDKKACNRLINKKVFPNELDNYLNNGWKLG